MPTITPKQAREMNRKAEKENKAWLDTAKKLTPPQPKTIDLAVPKGKEHYAEARIRDHREAGKSEVEALTAVGKELEEDKPMTAEHILSVAARDAARERTYKDHITGREVAVKK
jgi:hypothetical protein